ncbi:TonB-dependent receptor [[Actinobacillus] muris]|uniref:TonB-dependent receptor n=1 Tax=Muribacter muris TaxID=67855 RepID=A0A0J5P4P4_9PAST|nr:TonB-dependent receptor plug domain-containing protein [Muribacter muris]KMK50665.1 TonB-dependent receptor [[Actinobacillus] muris] [Muribacter muris]
MSTFRLRKLSLFISAFYTNSLWAVQEEKDVLPEVVVYGNQNLSLSSIYTVSQQEISHSPATNGNISDYLQTIPALRAESSDKDGFRQGEIQPESFSINGADADQTAYFVDNTNANNDLALDNEVFDGSAQVLPAISHRQAYFFDSALLSSIAVHDKNISASLGGFTGGAVVAKTKQYNGENHLRLKYRTTNSAWARLNADNQARSVLNKAIPNGSDAIFQPKYNKEMLNLSAETRLTDNIGMVVGLSRRHSDITQHRIIGINGKTDKQLHTRNSDNALLNLNWSALPNHRFEWGLRYSNYRENKFYASNIDNNLTDYHTAYGTTLAWIYAINSGVLTNTFAYDVFTDRRKSQSATAEIVNVMNEDFDSLYDYEKGGYGNSRLKQANIHYSLEYAIDPFNLGHSEHTLSMGGIYQHTDYTFKRDHDVYSLYKSEYIDGSPTTETPKQLFAKKGKVKTSYQSIALYLEDLVKIGQFEFRPGLRLERDNYLKNTNIAPRFVAQFKPREETQLTIGLNRYYGRAFSGLKLSNKVLSPNERYRDINKLKTPYSDELTLGISQAVGNWEIQANYTHRQNKQRIRIINEQIGERPNGDPIHKQYYKNDKPYSVNIYTLQFNNIKPWHWGITEWQTKLALDWLDTRRVNTQNPHHLVYLNGKLTTRAEMERKVNSHTENWLAHLNIEMMIPNYHLTWSNKLSMKAPIKQYEQLDQEFNNLSAYRSYHYGSHTQWDSSIRWQPHILNKHKPYIKIDIINVLNKTRKIKSYKSDINTSEYGIYTPGRQFWLELGYAF